VQTSVVQAPLKRCVEALLGHRVWHAQGEFDADHFPCGLAFIMACLANVRPRSVAKRLRCVLGRRSDRIVWGPLVFSHADGCINTPRFPLVDIISFCVPAPDRSSWLTIMASYRLSDRMCKLSM
jgi:hypothetical protein